MIRNSKLEIRNSLTKNSKFFVKCFGCQYNEYDALTLANELKKRGLVESNLDEADYVFVLNCSVRKTGVDRAMGFVRNIQNKKVFISGCVLETDKKRFAKKNSELFELSNINKLFDNELLVPDSNLPVVSKYIPIMKGCNNFCSYCVVPYTRGREESRKYDDVILDAQKVIASGQKEIWLLGQNVNSYRSVISSHCEPTVGWTEQGERSHHTEILRNPAQDDRFVGFAELLKSINNLDGDFQIFFTSNHPKDMSDEIIDTIAKLPKVAKIIHLPVQSGSNKVLRSMNRPYTIVQYLGLIKKIKKNIPSVKITTDVIVGFPTETEADFGKTVELFEKVNYFQAYINKYSPREGTAAFKLGDPITWSEKERRWRILNEIVNNK